MTMKSPLIVGLTASLFLTGCVSGTGSTSGDPGANAREGALAGAVIGSVAGAITGKGNGSDRLGRAIGGAVIGAALGGIGGTLIDQQEADLRGALGGNVTVTNMGDYLVVNLPQDLLFAVDSASLRPDLLSDLNAVAASLNKYPSSTVEVIGHTDNSGSAAYNQDLSQRRASTVASSLIGYGVPSSRVRAIGRGEDQPIASNLNPQGMAMNRRVEIIIRPN
jgi:outer membrane protein OmpA-like peptidoglycan-associated protein